MRGDSQHVVPAFYHKAFRLELGDLVIGFRLPALMESLARDIGAGLELGESRFAP